MKIYIFSLDQLRASSRGNT